MNDQDSEAPLSLYQAARNMGVKFTKENSPTDKYIDVNNLKIHYLEWGDIQNPTIILVHGIAQTCHSWDFIALGLSEKLIESDPENVLLYSNAGALYQNILIEEQNNS